MTCEAVTLPGLGQAIVCSRGPRRRAVPCSCCSKPHVYLCDAEVGDGKTCDAMLCEAHALRSAIAAGRHLCQAHARALPEGPYVVNRHAYRGRPFPTPWVYVGRGHALGNPFTVEQHGANALTLYEQHLRDALAQPEVAAALNAITAHHVLICSCAPRPCHADAIVRVARERVPARRDVAAQPERAVTTVELFDGAVRVTATTVSPGEYLLHAWEHAAEDRSTHTVCREDRRAVWGRVDTRRFAGVRPADVVERQAVLVEHELQAWRRAVGLIRTAYPGLGNGPGAGVFETCGRIRVLGRADG